MTVTKRRSRRVLIALISAFAVIGIVVPTFSSILTPQFLNQANGPTTTTTTTTAPVLTIKPLSVRPVVTAFVTTPEECPPPAKNPPADKPLKICDIPKTAVYDLEPEALTLQLTKVESFRNPLTGAETVSMTMTPESAEKFGTFTKGMIDRQIAFVRAGTVVWGPKITTPIEGTVLQLSGELTPEQAADIERMLRNDV
jgi:hypothetical protein